MQLTITIRPSLPAEQHASLTETIERSLSARVLHSGIWPDDDGGESDLTLKVSGDQSIRQVISGFRQAILPMSLPPSTNVRLEAADLVFSLVA